MNAQQKLLNHGYTDEKLKGIIIDTMEYFDVGDLTDKMEQYIEQLSVQDITNYIDKKKWFEEGDEEYDEDRIYDLFNQVVDNLLYDNKSYIENSFESLDPDHNSWQNEQQMGRIERYNPCDGCGGEDCVCCEYGRGW